MKKIALLGEIEYLDDWLSLLGKQLPDYEIYVWPNVSNKDQVDVLLTWNHPKGILGYFSNAKLIISLGAGVDHLLDDPDIPSGVPIVRLVASGLSIQMAEYVSLAVLLFQRRFLDYMDLQRSRQWKYLPSPSAEKFTVGIMGVGVLGSCVAERLKVFSFPIRTWSRTPRSIEGIECFYGEDQFTNFLSECSVLVCLLPLTKETEGILNQELFSALPRGAFLINSARGKHLVEADLIRALDSGQLEAACLDVFKNEPLPTDNPLWSHPRVIATPHISAVTIPDDVIDQVVNSIRRLESNLPLDNLVNRNIGY